MGPISEPCKELSLETGKDLGPMGSREEGGREIRAVDGVGSCGEDASGAAGE